MFTFEKCFIYLFVVVYIIINILISLDYFFSSFYTPFSEKRIHHAMVLIALAVKQSLTPYIFKMQISQSIAHQRHRKK